MNSAPNAPELRINKGVREFQETPGAILLDVRMPQEFAAGHIPQSVNVSLQDLRRDIDCIEDVAPEKGTPLFVYCRSGHRSGEAVALLQNAGYTHAENIGGIMAYHGPIA